MSSNSKILFPVQIVFIKFPFQVEEERTHQQYAGKCYQRPADEDRQAMKTVENEFQTEQKNSHCQRTDRESAENGQAERSDPQNDQQKKYTRHQNHR